jgi:hypothetical protein
MNVPNIGQGAESVVTLSRTIVGSDSLAPRVDAAGADPAPKSQASPAISFTRLACFDVNGDGNIDTRSAAAGGDATLLVPTHAVDLPTYSRRANPMGDGHPLRAKESDNGSAPAGAPPNAAQTNRAADAYERYGQTPPPAPPPPSRTPAPAPAPAAISAPIN